MKRMKIDIDSRDFFKDPLSESELRKIIKMTGKKPNELLRKRDKMYKELDLGNKKISEEKIIKLMLKNPGLIQRPIIISKNNAHVGKINPKDIKL